MHIHKIRIMILTMCVTIINSVMAISNPKIGSGSIPRHPQLSQEPLTEASSAFVPGVHTIVTCGSKRTIRSSSIQCDTDTAPPWNHLVRDKKDVSELGYPVFNMTTSYTFGARLP